MPKINRRDFLRLGVSLPVAGFTPNVFASDPAISASSTTGFTLYSASDNSQGLNQLSIWSANTKQSTHYVIPFRAHDILPFPDKHRILAFGRRPEMQCVMVDTRLPLEPNQIINANEGRHFLGHGCLLSEQSTLFTTESDYDKARGTIGIRDAQTLDCIGEYDTYGIGPHDIHLMPDGKTLVVANGGIETHPDYGRRKLNLSTMQPSLVYIDVASGKKIDEFRLSDPKLSIRHLVVSKQGDVGVATQFQGNTYKQQPNALVAWQPFEGALKEIPVPKDITQSVRGYMADIAFDPVNNVLITTAPRGNQIALWDVNETKLIKQISLPQPSGIQYSEQAEGFIISTAIGKLFNLKTTDGKFSLSTLFSDSNTAWDNHLILA